MNLFIAVRITVMDSLSASMKSSALPMAINNSSRTRLGIQFSRIHCSTDFSSCASIYSCPLINIGTSGAPVRSLSVQLNILSFVKIAYAMLNGAGSPLGNLNFVNSPGESFIANVMLCSFHCKRSSMPSSANRFMAFGYAPKKMCKPVSIQSPSASCHALTLPPSILARSTIVGAWPASLRYLPHDNPAKPPPMMRTAFFSCAGVLEALAASAALSCFAAW
mmetsp:Transcript_1924/g.6119  ORF Transcript_1924/g.6119 Transcript_1924/m.6119 type:complete len:221 (+) Transcript_1924:1634-2296(+)